VAAIVAVLGLSSSSGAAVNAEIAALGTNLLTVQNGQNFSGGTAELPLQAPGMISRLPGVYQVQSTGATTANAYRSPLIPSVNTNALTVDAATLSLPAAAETSLAQGEFINAAIQNEPVCALGAAAAQLMGVDRIFPGERIWITLTNSSGNPAGGTWLYIAGILKPDVLAPEIDSSVFVGFPFAEKYLQFDGHPSTIYVKATDNRVNTVDNLLAAQANPQNPSGVDVTQPSVALVAQRDAKSAFNTVPGPRRGRPAGRRDRRSQHHGLRRARATQRDRVAPGAGRHPRPHPHPVPHRGHPARAHRRGGRRAGRRGRHCDLRP
jgi:putative ABC transport system permease protein